MDPYLLSIYFRGKSWIQIHLKNKRFDSDPLHQDTNPASFIKILRKANKTLHVSTYRARIEKSLAVRSTSFSRVMKPGLQKRSMLHNQLCHIGENIFRYNVPREIPEPNDGNRLKEERQAALLQQPETRALYRQNKLKH